MREISIQELESISSYAHTIYFAGDDVAATQGDRFFLMEMEEGDEWEGIILKSIVEKENPFFEWNHNGWWQQMSDEDIPDTL